ncbi:SET-domain-containing protein [Mycena kentingensis (nom. inval.)]|nr:SET-domain-containing protein [Mycena kentingensis (nom. inval.)]
MSAENSFFSRTPSEPDGSESGSEAEDQQDQDLVELREQSRKFSEAVNMRATVEGEFRKYKEEWHVKPAMACFYQQYPPIPTSTSSKDTSVPTLLLTPAAAREDAVIHYEFDADGNVQQSVWAPLVDDHCSREFMAHPAYRYCVPAPANMLAPSEDSTEAPYMPFADAQDYPALDQWQEAEYQQPFPYSEYIHNFSKGALWAKPAEDGTFHAAIPDPDEELIRYETIRRLYNLGYTEADLDYVLKSVPNMGEEPLYGWIERVGRSYESGFLWRCKQRDMPLWSNAGGVDFPNDFGVARPEPHDIIDQINAINKKFCSNLGCITPSCRLHVSHDYVWFSQPITAKATTLPHKELLNRKRRGNGSEKEPCSDNCFVDFHRDDEMDIDEDMSAEVKFAIGLLDIDPDMSPCDLAYISRIECRVAYNLRRALIDVKKRKKKKKNMGESLKLKPVTEKGEKKLRSYTYPCSHFGPCNKKNNCECVRQNAHCERNCGCDLTCERRWRGCNITCKGRKRCNSPSKTTNHTTICACKAVGRECDPELCTSCRARSTQPHNPRSGRGFCDNMQLQRAPPAVVIRKSQYGLGAYAGQSFDTGEMIGEYVGEVIENDAKSLGHREILHKHLSNYCYELGRASIDARLLGNLTRFLNDAKPAEPNCEAFQKLVNGQKRLGIRASQNIKLGEELTLSYGDPYWTGEGQVLDMSDDEQD